MRQVVPFAVGLSLLVLACAPASPVGDTTEQVSEQPYCKLVQGGFGPAGEIPLTVDRIAEGLEVPWAIAFLPNGDALVTERVGRVRLIRAGALVPAPVATIALSDVGQEGGLLGVAVSPDFETARHFFLYVSDTTNDVQRWILSEDGTSATFDRIILGEMPSADYHSGGRMKFGPDGMLYVSTGDAYQPPLAQDLSSTAGKLLRMTRDGEIPQDNPFPGSYAYLLGIRNCQGFDWADDGRLYVTDHGPTGDTLRWGKDEVNLVRAGDNLGWPELLGCQSAPERVTPSLTWDAAVPPGASIFYRGTAIPALTGSVLVTTLGARHLHRVVFDPEAPERVLRNEVYLHEQYGRLRELVTAPDGTLWLTTSNCDSYGSCPPEKDLILRLR